MQYKIYRRCIRHFEEVELKDLPPFEEVKIVGLLLNLDSEIFQYFLMYDKARYSIEFPNNEAAQEFRNWLHAQFEKVKVKPKMMRGTIQNYFTAEELE